MKLYSPYVPVIGSLSDRETRFTFEPKPYSTVLALSAPCASGKSASFHTYMEQRFESKPNSRFLLTSANILYTHGQYGLRCVFSSCVFSASCVF